MSGGHFEYAQRHIGEIADSIEDLLKTRNRSLKSTEEMQNAIRALRIAHVYAQRIDWLLCGDDGEEEFHSRLKHDITKVTGKKYMANAEQTNLVAEHIKKMTYRELSDLAETLHGAVKSWEEDDDDVRPDDFAKTLLGWADSVPSNDK